MEQVASKYNVDTSQLIRQINKIIIKGEQKPAQKEYTPTNKDILDYLKKLDSKLDEINSKLDNLEYLR
jgi:antitoxin component of RelBE/YafQ-DinJ toxin-antitoxin module